jgi:hypothetical protein
MACPTPEWDKDSDRIGALDPQIACHDIGAKAMLIGQRLDPFTGFQADAF